MRRFLLLLTSLAILALVFGVVGCGGDDEATPTPGATQTPVETMNLTAMAEAIRSGDIDVGTELGMGVDQRYHKIHAVVGLECVACHMAEVDATSKSLSAWNESPQSPGAVDQRGCLGCHSAGGPAQTLYE